MHPQRAQESAFRVCHHPPCHLGVTWCYTEVFGGRTPTALSIDCRLRRAPARALRHQELCHHVHYDLDEDFHSISRP